MTGYGAAVVTETEGLGAELEEKRQTNSRKKSWILMGR